MTFIEARTELELKETAEALSTPEIPRRKMKKMVVLSGPSYAGKTELKKIIEKRLGYVVEDGKETFERRTGIETGQMKKTPQAHKRFDGMQAKAFRTTTEEALMSGDVAGWWETRLAGVIAAEVMDKRERQIAKREFDIARAKKVVGKEIPDKIEPIPIVTVLITADEETRINRAHKESVDEAKEEGKPEPSRTSVKKKLLQRERKNRKDWAPIHPKYIKEGQSPFHQNKIRSKGITVYMLVIDNSKHKSPEETFNELMRGLEAFDVFVPLTIQEVENGPREEEIESGDIFIANETGPKRLKNVKTNGSRSKSRGNNPSRGSFGGRSPEKITKAKSGSAT